MKQQTAQLNNLRIAPRKVRFVADLLRGLTVTEAEAQLLIHNRRSAAPLLKLLRSAVANAVNNQKISPDSLRVKEIFVGQGTMLKPCNAGTGRKCRKNRSSVCYLSSTEKRKKDCENRGKKTKGGRKRT